MLGIVTGVMSKSVNYPLLVWKNTVQQGLKISVDPRIVYRGLPMACLNLGGTNAVQFASTGLFQNAVANAGASPATAQISGAFLGGLASGIPCSMWELCMIQQQRFGGSLLGTPVRILNEYGISGLFRGVVTTCGRESMFTMAMLGITPLIQNTLVESSYKMEKNSALAAGALTGACFAATLTHPLDTIKTCMQGDLGMVKYTNIMSTGRLLTQEYGVVQGLFKGLSYRIGLISTTFFLVNFFKQKSVPILFPHAA